MLQIMNGFFQSSGNKNSVSNEALEVWFDFFGDLRAEVFRKALKQHCITSKFQPTPSEIYIQLDAIRIEMFSKIHAQKVFKKILAGEIELEEDETLGYYERQIWNEGRLAVYEAELETLNNVLAVKYGG